MRGCGFVRIIFFKMVGLSFVLCPLENISLIWRSVLGDYGRDLYRGKPAVTRDLG